MIRSSSGSSGMLVGIAGSDDGAAADSVVMLLPLSLVVSSVDFGFLRLTTLVFFFLMACDLRPAPRLKPVVTECKLVNDGLEEMLPDSEP